MQSLTNIELIYEPAPSISEDFERRFKALVGQSPTGEPLMRWVWGCDRTEFVAGFQVRRYGDIDNTPAKYIGRCRWHLEGWTPADVYDEQEWEKDKGLLGEFPRSGVYDFIAVHVDPEGGYLPLDDIALRITQNALQTREKGSKRAVTDLILNRAAMWEMEEKNRAERAEAVAAEFGDTCMKAFDTSKDVVSTSGKDIGYSQRKSGILVPQGV